MGLMKRSLSKLLAMSGYKLVKQARMYEDVAVELQDNEVELLKYVVGNRFTMTSIPGLVATIKACKYVVENNIPGDFVECGVWRGGNGILAKKIFEAMGSNKKVHLFDTFAGMTEPTEQDVAAKTKEPARIQYDKSLKSTHSEWCYASVEDVKNNFVESSVDLDSIRLVVGDVCKTLEQEQNIPKEISILRLDTDWYDSTKKELEILYPLLAQNGVLMIDDYGYWEGARKAVDEFFSEADLKPLIQVIDHSVRSLVKP